jgi:hypothetical protein
MDRQVDILLTGGTVVTMNREFDIYEVIRLSRLGRPKRWKARTRPARRSTVSARFSCLD